MMPSRMASDNMRMPHGLSAEGQAVVAKKQVVAIRERDTQALT